MIAFELPASRDGAALRGISLGSCRVRAPLLALRDRGDLRTGPESPSPSHTAAEALQNLAVVLGERAVPEHLCQYIYESDHRPSVNGMAERLRQGVDVFVLEVSDDKQFTYGDLCLNQNFVTRNLVQAHRGALLDWYRNICRGGFAAEDTVQSALSKLRDGGFDHDEAMANLLRGVRLERRGGEETAEKIATLTSKMGGQWVLVGLFTVEGDDGDVMRRRRELNEALKDAAARYDTRFYDPSELLVRYGRERVLDAGGSNIYEYAQDFYATVGVALVSQVRALGPPPTSVVEPSAEPAPSAPTIARPARAGWARRGQAKIAVFLKTSRRFARKSGRWLARRLRGRSTVAEKRDK